MVQDIWNAPPGFRPTKSAPSSPAKPLGLSRTRSEMLHVAHKVPVGGTPYVRAKNMQLVDKDPERAIPLFWAAINAGDRVDSALKDMAIVMKQQNRAEEAVEAIKSLRHRCSDQAQEALDNILLDLYKRCGMLDDQITLLKHKLYLIKQGKAFNGKRTKTARSHGKKFQISVEQEATRLLGDYREAEETYRQALTIAPDNNKMCNLGTCLMKQGMIGQAKDILRQVKPAVVDGPRGIDSHLKAYERARQMLKDLESETMNKAGDKAEQSRLFNAFLGSSSIWQPQRCRDYSTLPPTNSFKIAKNFADENTSSNIMPHQAVPKQRNITPVIQAYSLNIKAPPFFSSNSNDSVVKNPTGVQFAETLKRTRSANAANQMVLTVIEEFSKPSTRIRRPETGAAELISLSEETADKMTEFLPDKDFEEAILATVLGEETTEVFTTKVEKRLKVFEDIALCSSPKA